MKPRLDIMVLNYNGAALLAECLPAVVTAAACARLAHANVLVVDNNSTDSSREYVAAHWPAVHFAPAPHNDYLFSLNWAAKSSEADLLLLLNNDVKPFEDSIDPLLAELLHDERVFSAAPCLLGADGATVDVGKCWGEFRRGFLHHESRQVKTISPNLFPPGAAFACQRAAFISLGGFDDLYYPAYWEDTDLGYRAWKAGYKNAHLPASRMQHLGSASWKQQGRSRMEYLYVRNAWLFTWRNVSDPAILAANLYWTLRYMLGAIRRHDDVRRKAYADAIARWPGALARKHGDKRPRRRADKLICHAADQPWE